MNELHERNAPRIFQSMIGLGGLYVKLGQVLSVTALPVPEQYRALFRTLQSDVPNPRDFDSVIRPTLERERGASSLDGIFESIDEVPCGAASIGQAHRAVLKGTGEEVIVKVQYPEARWQIPADVRCVGDFLNLCVLFGIVDGPSSKFFSNGLDLEWMMRANASAVAPSDGGGGGGANDAVSELIESFNGDVLARILTLPFRTVAAINGHCIGAGLFLALACDYRIMRTGRGFLQWPEARLGMRLTKGFAELTRAKVVAPGCDRSVLREGVLGARRYASAEAVASGIVDAEYPVEVLYEEAFRLAVGGLPDSKSGMDLEFFDPVAYTRMKVEMYADAYRALKFGRVADPPHSRI